MVQDRRAPTDHEPATVSVVVPVYRGADTIGAVTAAVAALRSPTLTPAGRAFRVTELVLVWDHGPDASDDVLLELDEANPWVRVIWLSRNFGQHAATVAGMAATGGEWIVTMDEDGQHDPAHIGMLLDAAYENRSQLVYAAPANKPPHGVIRNLGSRLTKTVFLRILSGRSVVPFHSYRLIAGDAGRAVAAYCGPGVYLDVALSWVIADVSTVRVTMRPEGRPARSYGWRTLLSHFWRLVLSSGNRPLRIVSAAGVVCSGAGILYAIWLVVGRLRGVAEVSGWTSLMVATLLIGGLILIALGIIAEYVGLAATMSMGKPSYVALDAPQRRFGPRHIPSPARVSAPRSRSSDAVDPADAP